MPVITRDNIPLLARIAQLCPNAAEVVFETHNHGCAGAELAAAPALLPDRCWPAVKSITKVPAPAMQQLARLCPLLQTAPTCRGPCCAREGAGAALCAALEALEAVSPNLEELSLSFKGCHCEPGDARRAGAALARLPGLRRLAAALDGEHPDDDSKEAGEPLALLSAGLPACRR